MPLLRDTRMPRLLIITTGSLLTCSTNWANPRMLPRCNAALPAAELYDLNRQPDALAAYEVMLATLGQVGDQAAQASVHWGQGRLHLGRYDFVADAVKARGRALRVWPPELENPELVRLLADGARAKLFSGDAAAAIQLAERAVTLAERLGDVGLIARGRRWLQRGARRRHARAPDDSAP